MKNNHNFLDSGLKKELAVILAGTLSLLFAVLTISTIVDISNKIKEGNYIGRDIPVRSSITVTETGEVYAVPDLGIISFSVIAAADTVNEAMENNTEDNNSIIEALKNEGIEPKDIKTTSFNVYPVYNYPENGSRTLDGYEVNQTVTVKIRKMDNLGRIISQATANGATNVSQLQLTIDDEAKLKDQARSIAIDKAKEKARKLAGQLGSSLGKVVDFNENFYQPYYFEETVARDAELGFGGSAPVPNIQTGENKISVAVTITYEIR